MWKGSTTSMWIQSWPKLATPGGWHILCVNSCSVALSTSTTKIYSLMPLIYLVERWGRVQGRKIWSCWLRLVQHRRCIASWPMVTLNTSLRKLVLMEWLHILTEPRLQTSSSRSRWCMISRKCLYWLTDKIRTNQWYLGWWMVFQDWWNNRLPQPVPRKNWRVMTMAALIRDWMRRDWMGRERMVVWYVCPLSGNRKDLKCVVCRLSSVVCGLCKLIPMYVHYYVNTVQYYFTR